MKRTAIGAGAYVDEQGRFWERPGGKTWRLLRSVDTKREAIRVASARDPHTVGRKFAALAQLYKDAHCPDGRLKPRLEAFTTDEVSRVDRLVAHFGHRPADKITVADIPAYYAARQAEMRTGLTGHRAVDKETQTLSNVYRYAVAARLFPFNPVATGRPRYQTAESIQHSRKRAPKTADVIHQVAGELFDSVATEVSGWFCLFAMFTGNRISELLRLRLDAKDENAAGYVQWRQDDRAGDNFPLGLLHLGARSKHGMNPESIIGPEFAAMLVCFDNWHRSRYPESPWYFPSFAGDGPIHRRIVHDHIVSAAARLKLPHITPHGFRSFYVTKRRSDGATDTVIAGEIGDKTVALMQTTYGERPKNWLGGAAVMFVPKEGSPAWEVWKSENRQEIDFLLTTAKAHKLETPIESSLPVWRNGRRTGLKITTDGLPIRPIRIIQAFSLDFRNPLPANPTNFPPEIDSGLTTDKS
jgi:integrase